MSILSFGELLIDFVALESGVSVGEASGFQKKPGGAPANVAVAVKRLGYEAGFITQVGDDPFGHYLVKVLADEGVDTSGVTYSTEARTALAFVSLRSDGERSFMFYRQPSADMLMRPEDVNYKAIDAYRIFHYGSITMISEPSRSATLAAVRYARAAGKLISYDPNLRLPLWPSADAARAGMLAGLEYAHVVKVSEEELEFLTGGQDVTPLWRDGLSLIIVTQGAGGATLHTRTGKHHEPGFRVQAVDTTGAGDGFVAGVLARMLDFGDDWSAHLPEIVRFANAVGALTTTERGAIPALPTRDRVERFIEKQMGCE
jgi:fructokinase